MENGDESAAAAAEAALGLNPQVFVNEVHGIVAEISVDAFEYCLQAAASPGVLGASRAAEKATDLQRGLNAIYHVVNDRVGKRTANWEKFCILHCFDVPEGLVATRDDNTSVIDGTSDSDLDLELDSLRRKLGSAYKESEHLGREMSSLERQREHKRKVDSAIADIQKLLEDNCLQQKFEDLLKATLVLRQKLIDVSKKRTENMCLIDPQVWSTNSMSDNKRQKLDKGSTACLEDIQEVIKILQSK